MFVTTVGVIGDEALAAAARKAGYDVAARAIDGPWDGFGNLDLVLAVADEQTFSELDVRTPENAILAATGRSAAVTELGDVTGRPDRVVGMHFVAGTRLVEVVEGDETSPETLQLAVNFAQGLKRQPVRCAESPGLLRDRILMAAAAAAGADELFAADALAAALADDELANHLVEAYGDRFAR